jgi:murein DD-endopeptidase MepM/ murein hydrolase activator NlpD
VRRGIAAAALALVLATLVGTARADTFDVLPEASPVLPALAALPSPLTPNGAGELVLPAALETGPVDPQQLDYEQLLGIWQRAGAAYGIPWPVLASINKIESNFGRNMGPSSAGAIGWMQFMPSTWLRWGIDANGDGVADPWNPDDAIYSAARYLAAAGGQADISRAVYAYNHADWYVQEVLGLANVYGASGDVAFSLDALQAKLQQAQQRVVAANERYQQAAATARRYARAEHRWRVKEDAARLLSDRLDYGKQAGILDALRHAALADAARKHRSLANAQADLAEARDLSRPASFDPGAGDLLQAPAYSGGYVFPVGGGPSIVSVAHTHHDYPAADIAAPMGTPVYALADGVVLRAWHTADPRCGIGLTLRAVDGQAWTYCHLSYEDPTVEAGAQLTAGQPVGLVGATGDATGPHLHLQLQPATLYPQDEAWFQSFAGAAFRWQDAETPGLEPADPEPLQFDVEQSRSLAAVHAEAAPTAPAPAPAGRVFDVVPAPDDSTPVVEFSR